MNALTVIPAASVPASLAEAELDAALSFAEQEKSAATRCAYRSDWRIFTAWCALHDLAPLPAAPGTVARFLSSQAVAGVKASTISRRCAAIGYAHKLAGHREPPSNAETVKAVMRGIRRSIGTASTQKAPATADIIGEMLKHCPDTLAGKRDRALLALASLATKRRLQPAAACAQPSPGPSVHRMCQPPVPNRGIFPSR
jgi:site-specific recombinase XerD